MDNKESAKILKNADSKRVFESLQHNQKPIKSPAKDASKEIEQLAYSISHDLQTPLRVIKGFSTILKEDYYDTLDKEGNEIIDTIIENSIRMDELIKDILSYSRVSTREMSKNTIDTTRLITEVINELKLASDLTSYTFKITNKIPDLYGDRLLIKQGLKNIIDNAIKFSRNKKKPVIEVGHKKPETNTIQLYVKDNGVGFDMTYYDKIFEVFQKLHRHEEFEGSGIGLAITEKIIRRHEGSLWAESTLNKKSVFYIALPTS